MSELFFSLFFPYVATNLLQTEKKNSWDTILQIFDIMQNADVL